ncbi:MAG: hypothetical protein AAGE84_18990 [Cyanobacteria bacterium P01_G01_bin.39]
MGSRTSIIFTAVEREIISLPILDWTNKDNGIWRLFENARDNKFRGELFELSGRHGRHFHDILTVKDRCKLHSLDFLELDILEDERGAALQDTELISVVRSLTIIIDELLNAVDPLYCLPTGHIASKDNMYTAWLNSKIDQNVDLDYYEESGLFIILKTLLLVATNALVNNKVFVYIQFTV